MTLEQDIAELDDFTQNFYHGEGLSTEEAQRNLMQGVVELTESGQHSSCGLLITRSGYVLTAGHCVHESGVQHKDLGVRNARGINYKVERTWADDKFDIGLVKVNMNGSRGALRYRFLNPRDLQYQLPIALLTLWDGQPKTSPGNIREIYRKVHTQDGHVFDNQFGIVEVIGKPGYSGSVVQTHDARIVGFSSTGSADGRFRSGTKLETALSMLHHYKEYLRR